MYVLLSVAIMVQGETFTKWYMFNVNMSQLLFFGMLQLHVTSKTFCFVIYKIITTNKGKLMHESIFKKTTLQASNNPGAEILTI